MNRTMHIYPEDRVTLREVGLRDGLQLVRQFPSTQAKRDWLHREYAAGVRHFEIGSFLPASRMPQFADIRDLIEEVATLPKAFSSALTLNERALSDAMQTKVDEVICVVSATEDHSRANMRRSRDEAVALVASAREAAGPDGPLVNAGIAMAFGCSISGAVAQTEVLRLAEACLDAGADVVGVADTVGYAGPRQISAMCDALNSLCGDRPYTVHLHDTRGMGIANAAAALDAGCRVLDGALAGLGGCPFAPGASGNVVFEDLVFLAETMGLTTGIDLTALVGVRDILAAEMPGETLHGALAEAGAPNIDWAA
ncbi:hydroxymethylglutaryl-CoA lyase [Antarctobacter sp.]|uniref:hydroxymethylglutaryl-CoA lyase n=1 Tax=Antarctobacter sp. TaxID=1872577 RepID=UPI003A944AB8